MSTFNRAELQQIREQAQTILSNRAEATAVVGELQRNPLPAALQQRRRVGNDSASIEVIAPWEVTWPDSLYARVELEQGSVAGSGANVEVAVNILKAFIEQTAGVPRLVDDLSTADTVGMKIPQVLRGFIPDDVLDANDFKVAATRGLAWLTGSSSSKKRSRTTRSSGSRSGVAVAQAAASQLTYLMGNPSFRSTDDAAVRVLELVRRSKEMQRRVPPTPIPSVDSLGPTFQAAAAQSLGTAVDNPDVAIEALPLDSAGQVVQQLAELAASPDSEARLKSEAEAVLKQLYEQNAMILMEQLPLDALKAVTNERLRFDGLDAISVRTVADVLRTPTPTLMNAHGVGEQTAKRMRAAATTLFKEASSTGSQATSLSNFADHTSQVSPSAEATALLRILARFEQVNSLDPVQRERRMRLQRYFFGLRPDQLLASGSSHLWVLSHGHGALEQFYDDLLWARSNTGLLAARSAVDPGIGVWHDYRTNPARFQHLLALLLDEPGRAEEDGTVLHDAAIVDRIRSLELDTRLLKDLFLRGYQSYGARFALVQKKTVLGDEMGLGKTVQAIAFAAHVCATEAVPELSSPVAGASGAPDLSGVVLPRVLVVCPASVIINWVREVAKFSYMPVFKAHGDTKDAAMAAWLSQGGVLVCSFTGSRTLPLEGVRCVIVDEAHYVKNPEVKRSLRVAELVEDAEYALLMTGTPLENRVEEFVTLVRYVQPELLKRGMGSMGAEDFRAAVAPAYLRRNQADVLDELPDREDSIDWVELSDSDDAAYRQAVAAGHWMQMRQAAYLGDGACAKVERIAEICSQAGEHGRKVLVFSFFLEPLNRIAQELESASGVEVIGRISGAQSPAARQELVDAFTQFDGPCVLLSQVQAGGVGLNIQAASVVIIAEPQIKPSAESQAIARAYRMGQVMSVQVHRIAAADTVDERIMEILKVKSQAFDEFARESVSADIDDAVDVSEGKLAREIIAAERERLGLQP